VLHELHVRHVLESATVGHGTSHGLLLPCRILRLLLPLLVKLVLLLNDLVDVGRRRSGLRAGRLRRRLSIVSVDTFL